MDMILHGDKERQTVVQHFSVVFFLQEVRLSCNHFKVVLSKLSSGFLKVFFLIVWNFVQTKKKNVIFVSLFGLLVLYEFWDLEFCS